MDRLFRVLHAELTDVGLKRSHNQDSFGTTVASSEDSWRSRGHLFVVADGMGAHAVGELASKIAVDTIRMSHGKGRDPEPSESLRAAFTEANETIHNRGTHNVEFQGMGTTATALLLRPEGALVGHVGDSRCYRIRGSSIEQLSFDHSLQWELARKHKVTPEKLTSVPTNIIVRSLGPEPKVKVDVNGPYRVQEGDRFLLCSDGLSGPVQDQELWALTTYLPLDEAARILIDLANIRGGMDNITVLLVQVGDPRAAEPAKVAGFWSPEQIWQRLKKVPLPWWFLFAGLTTAALGYGMGAAGVRPNVFFLISVLALVLLSLALWGLILRRERLRKEAARPVPEPPPVYRYLDCRLDRTLVERFAGMEQNLYELAMEQSWKVQWGELARTRASAAEALSADRLEDAFVGYCRALALLTAGMRAVRERAEVFRPHWEGQGV